MPTVRMKVEAFGSLASLSTEYPTAEFTLLTSFSTEDGHVTLVKITGLDHEIARRCFETDPDVQSYDVLHDSDRELLVQFIQQSEPAPGRAARESATPPPFPMLIRNGWVLTEATTTHDQLAQFTDELEAADISYEIVSILQSTDPDELLTDRQRQFVTAAIDRGYYDSPRRCTLTDLAADLNVNKATASGILHRAEGTILKEFMNGPV
ncbi:helix-turn-helix domain-containing protein [Haladaptatus pallidirubidus]|uniref:HTH bat-type domain-containing protein n=1 Tax=Haladaptatus pallidirubidus TaxID=1008152 RepID=A0AAV3UIC6_9EURY|nr:helix-turn-helix domain-containing protein [Haladaptatus pallidirubidus]